VNPRPAAAESPALWLVAPFFLAAPLGLVAAGILLATSQRDAFVAINLPRTVAITHALVVGWVSTTMMGAVYQFGPVVIGGRLWSERLARVQFVTHALAVTWFVLSLSHWHLNAMGGAGVLLVVSFILFLLNAGVSVARAPRWNLPRAYLAVSLTFLGATFVLGITYVGTLQHLWFPITLGRLSAHAHLGLAGWLGLTLMGVSYQLVPMFTVVQRAKPRFGRAALIVTSVSAIAFAWFVSEGAGPPARVLLAVGLATGPALWAADEIHLLRHRVRRRLDVQGHATYGSLAFLSLAAAAGMMAAAGTPFTPSTEPARWLLAYGTLAIGGWMGLALIGNSYKILPFIVWYHRYLPHAGQGPIPVAADIYHEGAANAVLALHAGAVAVLAAAALLGQLELLRAGGVLLAAGGACHGATMLHMFLPKTTGRGLARAGPQGVTS